MHVVMFFAPHSIVMVAQEYSVHRNLSMQGKYHMIASVPPFNKNYELCMRFRELC